MLDIKQTRKSAKSLVLGTIALSILLVLPWHLASAQGSGQPAKSLAENMQLTKESLNSACIASLMYAADYDDKFVDASSDSQAMAKLRPYEKSVPTTHNPNGGKLQFNLALAGLDSKSIPDKNQTVLFYDQLKWPDGSHLAGDVTGHVKDYSSGDSARMEKSLAKRHLHKR